LRKLAVIGASWGGLHALGRLLAGLDSRCTLSIVIAQHRAVDSPDQVMRRFFEARCPLPASEVNDKDEIEPGHVYIAPADYHTLVEPGHFALSIDAPVMFSRPSIDVLFESAADSYGSELVAVVLTGANDDGSRGMRYVHERGGLTIVQDPSTAERPQMPAAALATGAIDRVLPIEEITLVLNEVGVRA
jgi:two-component system, chemotaxis family, protein-glutamate methylesterase/glutaminase